MPYQMICPYCKKEFPYDNGELDHEITEAGQRIHEILRELSHIKSSAPAVRKAREGRRKVLILEMSDLQVKLGRLKAIRKACDQQMNTFKYNTIKSLIRERCGEKVLEDIMAQMEQEISTYRVSGLMRHEYSRSGAKSNVTSINKL